MRECRSIPIEDTLDVMLFIIDLAHYHSASNIPRIGKIANARIDLKVILIS